MNMILAICTLIWGIITVATGLVIRDPEMAHIGLALMVIGAFGDVPHTLLRNIVVWMSYKSNGTITIKK